MANVAAPTTTGEVKLVSLGAMLKTASVEKLQAAIAQLQGEGVEFFVEVPPTEVSIWRSTYDADGQRVDELVDAIDDFHDSSARLTTNGLRNALAATTNLFRIDEAYSDQPGFSSGRGASRKHYLLAFHKSVELNISSIKIPQQHQVAAETPAPVATPSGSDDCFPMLLSDGLELWVTENSASNRGSWSKSTEQSYRAGVAQFIAIVGDKLTTQITPADLLRYEKLMKSLPKDWALVQKRTGYSLEQIAHGDGKKVSAKTLKDKGSIVAGFFGFLKTKGVWHGKFGGSLFSKVKQRPKSSIVREALTDDDIREMLAGKGVAAFESAKFPLYVWGTLLLLYTGARASEVSQLRASDVLQTPTGTWYLKIFESDAEDGADNGKSLKTWSSVRSVPIHPVLIDLGFIQYASQFKRDEPIFPEAYRHIQRVSREIGDWVNGTLLPTAGLKRPGIVLHSFRHTVIHRLKHDATMEYFACAYTGHSTIADKSGSNRDFVETYGKGFDPDLLASKLHPLLNFDFDIEPLRKILRSKNW